MTQIFLPPSQKECNSSIVDYLILTNKVFGVRNKLIHRLLASYLFVWLVESNGLIYHQLISHKLIISNSTRNEVIPSNLENGLRMHHVI
jgi:hypothetical protein